MDRTDHNGLYSGAIGPLVDGLAGARQVEPHSAAADALDKLADPKRLQPEDLTQIHKLIPENEQAELLERSADVKPFSRPVR